MKKAVVILLCFAAAVIFGVSLLGGRKSETTSQAQTVNPEQKAHVCQSTLEEVTVVMKADAFDPETLTIKKCTKVTFVNADTKARWPASNLHPTHGIYPEFDPQEPIEAGDKWGFLFDKVGNWKYHDHLIPFIRAVIEVSQ